MAAIEINLIVAAEVNFRVYEEDTTGAKLYFTSNNVAVDLSSSTINMQVRQTAGGTLVDTFSSTGGTPDITIGGGGDNEVTIKGWDRLTAGTYVYDLEVETGSERVTYLYGSITVRQDVTDV